MRVITLGDGKRVTLKNYIVAVRRAAANPTAIYDRGLTCWYPCTGRDIMAQFREGAQDRINQAIPASRRK